MSESRPKVTTTSVPEAATGRGSHAPRGLGRLLTAAVLARCADASAGVVILLASVERYHTPAPGALALAALLIPHVVAGPFAGILTDRAARPRLVHAGFIAVFAVCLGAVPLLLGRIPLPAVLLLAVIAGCCGPMILGGLSSRVDDVTPPARRPHARGLDAATYNIAEIAGPAAGASITATLGVAFASVVLAAAALIASAVVVSITAARAGHEQSHEQSHEPSHEPSHQPSHGARGGSVRQDLRAGLRAVLDRPALRAVTAATCLASFGVGALTPTAVLLGIRAGHAAAGALLITAFGVGALAGSLLVARYPIKRWPAHHVALICLVGTGLALGVVAVAPPMWALSVVLFAIAGSFDGPLLASLLEVRSAEAPAHLRTQVFTLGAGLKVSAASLGSAAFALVVGLPATLVLGLIAATHGIAAVVGVLLLRTRKID